MKSLILVEDDERLAELVSQYLTANGFSVTRFADGEGLVADTALDLDSFVALRRWSRDLGYLCLEVARGGGVRHGTDG